MSLCCLQVNSTYQNVCVTNVDPAGIIYCQLPSRGRARLCKLLEETQAIFSSQVGQEAVDDLFLFDMLTKCYMQEGNVVKFMGLSVKASPEC